MAKKIASGIIHGIIVSSKIHDSRFMGMAVNLVYDYS